MKKLIQEANFEAETKAKELVDTTTHYGLARDYISVVQVLKEFDAYGQGDETYRGSPFENKIIELLNSLN